MGLVKIAVVTGSRSEYGLLEPLIKLFHSDYDIEPLLFVTGSHLSPQFGNTVKDIKYPITEKIEIVLASDTPVSISKAMGLALISFGEAYERHRPDMVVVLGDRFESCAAVLAAHIARIAISHLHGGELTEGSLDDAFRHSITKMSHLHFVAAGAYAKRVKQLGENPSNIYDVGALGCDRLIKRVPFSKPRNVMLIAHYSMDGIEEIISVLNDRKIYFDAILPSADPTSFEVISIIRDTDCIIQNNERESFLFSLRTYYDAIIGDSSCGIIECPAMGIPTINVGSRQQGRLMAGSIIHADPTEEAIGKAIDKLYSPKFQEMMKRDYTIHYKGGNVAEKIRDIIKEKLPTLTTRKKFYDIAV